MNDGISIALEDQGEYGLDGMSDSGPRSTEEEHVNLSEIIQVLNDRFGLDLTEGDKLYFDQMEEEFVSNEKLAEQAKSNTMENFKFGFDDVFLNTVISRMNQNKELFSKIMDDEEFNSTVKNLLLKKVYDRLRKAS